MTYEDFKDFISRTAADKVLRDKTLPKIKNMMDINVDLLKWFLILFCKKLKVVLLKKKLCKMKN